MSEKTAYCLDCGERTPYELMDYCERVPIRYNGKDKLIPVWLFEAYCSKCMRVVYVPEVNDLNVERMEEAVSRYKQRL